MELAVAFFVYGTLKTGQCRQRCWPRQPLKIQPAFVRGSLYDLGPYPAITRGDDWVQGELWWFDASDCPQVQSTLDEIEGFNQDGYPDLYLREQANCFHSSEAIEHFCSAQIYRYANIAELTPQQRMKPGCDQIVRWPV